MLRLILPLLLCCSALTAWATSGNTIKAGKGRPGLFMENKGQIHGPHDEPVPQVLYHLAGNGINVSLTARSIHYTFFKQLEGKAFDQDGRLSKSDAHAYYETLGMDVALIGANPSAKITAEAQQEYYENHYTTAARRLGGIQGIRSFARLVYHDVYPHIDWVVYVPEEGAASGMKYDFVVHPGGNPSDIRLKYDGASALSPAQDGSLRVQTEFCELLEARPYSYVRESGAEVGSSYVLRHDTLSFSAKRPAAGTLVIDPQVIWATYFGGTGIEYMRDVAMYKGDAFVTGSARSTGNIATFGSFKTYFSGIDDAYLGRFAASGNLVWCTYYGGTGGDAAYAVVIDTSVSAGSVYICGATNSPDSLATAGSHQTNLNGNDDAFFAKFTLNGALIRATYFGGNALDVILAAACDAQGNLYVGGGTTSSTGVASVGFPGRNVNNAFTFTADGFVAKFNSSGVRQWGTCLGGEGPEWVSGLYAASLGSIAITGTTGSTTGIATAGSHQQSKSDSLDAFVAKLGASGNLIWSTYYGGNASDNGDDITGNGSGNIYACGSTRSQGNISAGSVHQTIPGGSSDAYLAKFTDAGALVWGTYYGGANSELGLFDGTISNISGPGRKGFWSVCFAQGKLRLAGGTLSTPGMATSDAYKDTLTVGFTGTLLNEDAVIASFDTLGNRDWATYFGGTGSEAATAIAGDNLGNVFVTGYTNSQADLAVSTPHQPGFGGATFDAFLIRIFDSLSILRVRNVRPYCINDTFSLGHYITANGTLQPGNIFRAELSNSSGSFNAPTVIGTLASPAGGLISCTLPAGISGTGYKLRIVSSKRVMVSDTVAISISTSIPAPVIGNNSGTLSTGTFAAYQWYKNGVAIAGATSVTYKPTTNGSYTVIVTATGGCKGTSSAYNISSVGVSGLNNLSDLQVYPNPTCDFLTIEGGRQGMSLVITNLLGQQVAELTLQSSPQLVSLSHLPAGIYMLIVSDNEGRKKTVRILKQ